MSVPASRDASIELEPTTANIPAARHFVREVLDGWSIAYPQAVPLLTSEAVTNAVVHAGTLVHVHVSVDAGMLRVDVHDSSPDMPEPQEPSRGASGGRGLALIEGLAADWGVEQIQGDGKTLWFVVPVEAGGEAV